jgi:hypothetical protein
MEDPSNSASKHLLSRIFRVAQLLTYTNTSQSARETSLEKNFTPIIITGEDHPVKNTQKNRSG